MSRQFATNVTTIYDIFCPVPFLPSPFGFRRIILSYAWNVFIFLFLLRVISCCVQVETEELGPLLGKDLAPYRIGKHSNPQNSPKIHQKYSKNTIFGILGVFLSYFACGGVFLFCRGPSFSQGHCGWGGGSYRSLFLLNLGRFAVENQEFQFWALVRLKPSKSLWAKLFPL